MIALLAGTADDRTKASPARAFAKQLGMDPPPDVLQATLSFRDRAGKTLYQVRIDSTLASWLQGRSQWFTLWSTLTPARLVEELPRDRASYVLRVGKGANRAKLDAWAKSLMAR
ncbi:MAG: hypothetical protein H0T89_20640 [Deltaproteobacteria bacterium]|nr:hypothetical protein [Deltaproteobacteria bacterium]MDQ3295549.1 hypothetical protein [Myxococcota bacterium]